MPDYWQYAPLRIVFAVKEYSSHKDQLALGVHVVDSINYEKCVTIIKFLTVRLLLFVSELNGLHLVGGDIMQEFLHAWFREKVYCRAGKEVRDKEGSIIVPEQVIYGLTTAANS